MEAAVSRKRPPLLIVPLGAGELALLGGYLDFN